VISEECKTKKALRIRFGWLWALMEITALRYYITLLEVLLVAHAIL
jgi:hypothetical protein